MIALARQKRKQRRKEKQGDKGCSRHKDEKEQRNKKIVGGKKRVRALYKPSKENRHKDRTIKFLDR